MLFSLIVPLFVFGLFTPAADDATSMAQAAAAAMAITFPLPSLGRRCIKWFVSNRVECNFKGKSSLTFDEEKSE